MATKKIYIGSFGPYEYDDTLPVDDPDGDFAGQDHQTVVTDGQLAIAQAPTADEEVIRLIDLGLRLLPPISVVNIDNPTELNTVSGILGTMALAYEIIGATGLNEYTIYAYDASGPAVNIPYIMDANGVGDERWIAVAGKYAAQNLNISGNIVLTGTVDGVDISAHAANANAHHAQAHLISSHTDTNLGAIANNDLWRWDDPSSKWLPKSIAEVILAQYIHPGSADIGGAANYSSFDGSGRLTLFGSAKVNRHIRVAAPSWARGASAPTPGFIGIWPTLIFDTIGADDEAHYSLICPFRMTAGSVIKAVIDFTHRDAIDVGTVQWDLEYICREVGEDITAATTTISGTSIATAQHILSRVQLTTGITGAVAHDIIGLKLSRNVAGGTCAVSVDLIQTHFGFIMDKLGEPT